MPFEDEIYRELQWRLRLDSVMAHSLKADHGKLLGRNRREDEEIEQLNLVQIHGRWY